MEAKAIESIDSIALAYQTISSDHVRIDPVSRGAIPIVYDDQDGLTGRHATACDDDVEIELRDVLACRCHFTAPKPDARGFYVVTETAMYKLLRPKSTYAVLYDASFQMRYDLARRAARGLRRSPRATFDSVLGELLVRQPADATALQRATERDDDGETWTSYTERDVLACKETLRDMCLREMVHLRRRSAQFVAALTRKPCVDDATRAQSAASSNSLDASGGVALDGVPYAFSSLHFHTPAENTLDGAANAMEMHLVHFAADGSGAIAVLGVLFKYAAEERLADATAERLLADVAADGGARRIAIEPGALWDKDSGYFRWQGSLTTPPCTGGVSWVLQKETRTVSREAVARFRAHLGDGAFPGNARPTQPLNGRTVRVFEPKSA